MEVNQASLALFGHGVFILPVPIVQHERETEKGEMCPSISLGDSERKRHTRMRPGQIWVCNGCPGGVYGGGAGKGLMPLVLM